MKPVVLLPFLNIEAAINIDGKVNLKKERTVVSLLRSTIDLLGDIRSGMAKY